jgi:hypothetical protein
MFTVVLFFPIEQTQFNYFHSGFFIYALDIFEPTFNSSEYSINVVSLWMCACVRAYENMLGTLGNVGIA